MVLTCTLSRKNIKKLHTLAVHVVWDRNAVRPHHHPTPRRVVHLLLMAQRKHRVQQHLLFVNKLCNEGGVFFEI